jgi:hypothetical protein
MASSQQLAKKAISYMTSDDQLIFEKFNPPQLAAINAALTRRLTLIQGKNLVFSDVQSYMQCVFFLTQHNATRFRRPSWYRLVS